MRRFAAVEGLIGEGAALAVSTPGYGCAAESLFKMCVGNGIGVALKTPTPMRSSPPHTAASSSSWPTTRCFPGDRVPDVALLGTTTEDYVLSVAGEAVDLARLQDVWEGAIESVFPYRSAAPQRSGMPTLRPSRCDDKMPLTYSGSIAKPRVIIPVFPGTNCEYDTAHAFERAGAADHAYREQPYARCGRREHRRPCCRHPREPDRHDSRRFLRR